MFVNITPAPYRLCARTRRVGTLGETRLDEVLRAQNPWWASGALPQRTRHTQARAQDERLKSAERAVLLTGPRRCGKTATLLRLLDGHLRAGKRPRDAAYVPLDHPVLRLEQPGPVIDRALKLMGCEGEPLMLLDGLQALPDWPERFLEILRTRPGTRIVAASSVAPGVEDPASFETVHLPPLEFDSYCLLRGVPDLGAEPLDLLDPKLPEISDKSDDYLFDRVLDPMLADYLVRGGFPEAVFEPDLSVGQQAVREGVVSNALYKDLPAVAGVQRVADLERVLLGVLLQEGAPLAIEAFADSVGLDSSTVGRYLDHLERVFLTVGLRNFAASTERSRPRIHPVDPSLPNSLLERGTGVLGSTNERRSLLVGTVVSHVARAARARGFDLAYFREGDVEADLVVVSPDGIMPILVVDREEVGDEEAAQVARLMKRAGANRAYLLSRARPRLRKSLTFFESVFHVPVAYFLYALR